MIDPTKVRNVRTTLAIWLCVAACTVICMVLLVGAPDRTSRFWLVVGSMVFAELVVFGYGLLFALRPASERPAFPITVAGTYVTWVYAAGVLGVTVVALLPHLVISNTLLVVLHLLLLMGLAVGLGYFALAGNMVNNLAARDTAQRTPWINFRNDLAALQRDVLMLDPASCRPLREAVDGLAEDARYATAESLAAGQAAETELRQALIELGGHVAALRGGATPPGTAPPRTAPAAGTGAEPGGAAPSIDHVGAGVTLVKRMRLTIGGREALTRQSR